MVGSATTVLQGLWSPLTRSSKSTRTSCLSNCTGESMTAEAAKVDRFGHQDVPKSRQSSNTMPRSGSSAEPGGSDNGSGQGQSKKYQQTSTTAMNSPTSTSTSTIKSDPLPTTHSNTNSAKSAKSTTKTSNNTQRSLPNHPDGFIKRYRIEIAASSSSVFSTLAAFPLDSVKTRMQTYQYRGFLDCVRHTYQTEKLGGFFRG